MRFERWVRNGMGGQTRVNLASGGHALPEETGASRLASPLVALHLLTHTYTRARELRSWRTVIPQGRGSSENTALTLISYLYILSCTLQSYLPCPASYTILFMDSPTSTSHIPPLPLRILFVCPLLLNAGAIHPKGCLPAV